MPTATSGVMQPQHEATRYERAEGLSTSIKNPNETISLVEKSTGFLFCSYGFDFLARLQFSELNFYSYRLRKFSNILYYSWKSRMPNPHFNDQP